MFLRCILTNKSPQYRTVLYKNSIKGTIRAIKSSEKSTYVLGEDEITLEVPVGVLALADPVCEGAVGLVPVHAHVARRVVDQVIDVVPQLPRPGSTRCLEIH